MLQNRRGQAKFEASCIALHLAQARSNLNDLSRAGSRAQRDSRLRSTPGPWPAKTDETATATPTAAQSSEFANSTGSGTAMNAAPVAGSSAPSLNALPRDFDESAGRSAPGALGGTAGLAPMISSIAEGLHEELCGFLASFSSRLAAREAALVATCDRAATVGDHGISELSKRVEDRLSAMAQQTAAEHEAALDVVREGLRRLRDEVTAQNARLESLVTGDDWGRQLREATRAFEQRSALRVEAVERHVEELRAKDAAGHRAWRDAVIQRVDAVERRLSKHFKDSNNVIDQVGKMVPDVERLQSLYDALQADHAAADTWQRRLFNCEAAVQRLAALETQCNSAERQSERFRDEASQSLRESLHLAGALGARLTTLESSEKSRDEHWKAAEKRVLAVVEQHHKRTVSSLDILRETSQQRSTDFDTRLQQRLEHVREDLEQRVIALAQNFKRDLHSLSLDIERLGRTTPLPRAQAQAEHTGTARGRGDQQTQSSHIPAAQSTYTATPAAQSSHIPTRAAQSTYTPTPAAQMGNMPTPAAQSTQTPTPTSQGQPSTAAGSRTRTASAPQSAHLPPNRYDGPIVGSLHAAPADRYNVPLRSASASAQMHREPVDFPQESGTTEQREASSGRSTLIGVDLNPAQMELEASRVFSEADDAAHASMASSEGYTAPGSDGVSGAPSLHSNLQEHLGNPAVTEHFENLPREGSGAAAAIPTGTSSSNSAGNVYDALGNAKLSGSATRSDYLIHTTNPATAERRDDAEEDLGTPIAQSMQEMHQKPYGTKARSDTDDDVEALMAESLRVTQQAPAAVGNVHLPKHQPTAEERAEASDASEHHGGIITAHTTHKWGFEAEPNNAMQAQVNDDADDDVEALMAQSMRAPQQQVPIGTPRDTFYAAEADEAKLQHASASSEAGRVSASWEKGNQIEPHNAMQSAFDDDSDDDVEALMTQSMRAHPYQAPDRIPSHTVHGAKADKAEIQHAAMSDEAEDDIEAFMAQSMNTQMHGTSLATSSANASAIGKRAQTESDDANQSPKATGMSGADAHVLTGNIENDQASSSPLQGKAGGAGLRLRMGKMSLGTAAASGAADLGVMADSKDDADDDDDDDIEALMAGSMQASRAAPGRRTTGMMRASSNVAQGLGAQASSQTSRDKRLNALLGFGEDEDED